jgi:hypothetical protein
MAPQFNLMIDAVPDMQIVDPACKSGNLAVQEAGKAAELLACH